MDDLQKELFRAIFAGFSGRPGRRGRAPDGGAARVRRPRLRARRRPRGDDRPLGRVHGHRASCPARPTATRTHCRDRAVARLFRVGSRLVHFERGLSIHVSFLVSTPMPTSFKVVRSTCRLGDSAFVSSKRILVTASVSVRALRVAIGLVALVLLLAACGSSSKSDSVAAPPAAARRRRSATLNGSGSTFQKTFDEAAIQGFQSANPSITVNYAGGGSGKGKTDLQTKTVDFAGTDSPIKAADLSKYQGGTVLYFPTVVGADHGLVQRERRRQAAALGARRSRKIFPGKIKKWNDARDHGRQPGRDAAVDRHHRSCTAPTRRARRATSRSTSPPRPAATGRSAAVTPSTGRRARRPARATPASRRSCKQTDGAIGYVDYSDAVASNLKFASIKNKAGHVRRADARRRRRPQSTARRSTPTSRTTRSTPSGADAYPITSPTWIIVYAEADRQGEGRRAQGRSSPTCSPTARASPSRRSTPPLPDSLQQKAIAQLSQLQIPA